MSEALEDCEKNTPNLRKKPSSLRYFQEGPEPIDLASWRLRVDGLVESPLSLTYNDLEKFPPVYAHRRTVCVCLWSIKRHWDGIRLADVLSAARVDSSDEGLYLKQYSQGTDRGIYDSTIHLKTAIAREAILATHVDGTVLPLENGFPLRLIDFGLYGYKCVKALARLEVTRRNEIGYWEDYAGYEIDGTIRPKKYYIVDMRRKIFFDRSGEVLDDDL